ncbi:ornithine aminotransferase [Devosia sp. Root436]|jgi:osmotically-inducible protein OsmY|uniref:BON domain-containing protein n=1 Tax=Devosia sp. Root436 TaxID=1736537 RepID=UPI0006FF0C12|nr:BON domain-containing protein [Devosia sp. Root436]KQX38167.1 ornithine aminotransferase [Devosia sp. Root436]
MSDKTLKQDILDELDFEPSIDAADIGVAVEDGIVTLTGHVTTFGQKITVEKLVARVKGVKGIAVEIDVRYPGTAGNSDDEIAKRAVNMLKWSNSVPADKVQVKVQDGWVTLTGTVDWNYQKTGAADAVRDLAGVIGISNQIALRPRVSSIDVKKHIEDSLKRNAELEAKSIRVNVAGNKVILEGNVKAWYERRIAEQAAWAIPGVTMVDDRLTIA